MKKFFVSMVLLLVTSTASVFADGLTATLQSGNKLQPFYGVDAFKQAYEAADSGAVITLSAGKFNTVTSIAKPIRIVGNYAFSASSSETTILSSLTIAANNVTVDGVYFSGDVTLGNIENCKLVHSWIGGTLKYSSTTEWHTNTVVDQCVVKTETAIKQGKNYTIKNSTINKFSEFNTSANIAYITNCVVYDFVYNHSGPSSSSSGKAYTPTIPIAIYKNNILGVDVTCYKYTSSSSSYYSYYYYNVYMNSPCEFYCNTFAMTYYQYNTGTYYYSYSGSDVYYNSGCLNSGNTKIAKSSILSSNTYPASPNNPATGQDGTVRGPKGGTGFSYYPNIPRITSKDIDSNTDATGKLNVKITVKAQ